MVQRLWYIVFCFVLVGCGENIERKQLNEPCTRTEQCVDGLVCLSGVCLEAADAGVGALPDPDAGS